MSSFFRKCLLATCLLSFCLLPCKGMAQAPFRVLASTFPIYIFASNVCANAPNVSLELLIPAAAGCPHDFSLRPNDLARLGRANVLLINGLGLEDFLLKALESAAPQLPIVVASQDVPTLETEDDGHGHGHINPHIFAAPRQAAIMVRNLAAGLATHDSANAAIYEANAEKYASSLESLSQAYEAVGKKAQNPSIALEHNALAYLAANAGLKIVAIFEQSASAAQLAQLRGLLEKEKPALLAGDSQYPDRLLKTLARESGLPFAQLNPCASGPADAKPDYYENVMKKNLEILEARFE